MACWLEHQTSGIEFADLCLACDIVFLLKKKSTLSTLLSTIMVIYVRMQYLICSFCLICY